MPNIEHEYSESLVGSVIAAISALIAWIVKVIRHQARIESSISELKHDQSEITKAFKEKIDKIEEQVDKILDHITGTHLH